MIHPVDNLLVILHPTGHYSFFGQIGDALDVTTPDPLTPEIALEYARLLRCAVFGPTQIDTVGGMAEDDPVRLALYAAVPDVLPLAND